MKYSLSNFFIFVRCGRFFLVFLLCSPVFDSSTHISGMRCSSSSIYSNKGLGVFNFARFVTHTRTLTTHQVAFNVELDSPRTLFWKKVSLFHRSTQFLSCSGAYVFGPEKVNKRMSVATYWRRLSQLWLFYRILHTMEQFFGDVFSLGVSLMCDKLSSVNIQKQMIWIKIWGTLLMSLVVVSLSLLVVASLSLPSSMLCQTHNKYSQL